MISTVTTSTVSTITSSVVVAATLGLLAVIALAAFLVAKELSSSAEHPRLQLLSKLLNVAIVPLLIVFASIVVAKAAEAL